METMTKQNPRSTKTGRSSASKRLLLKRLKRARTKAEVLERLRRQPLIRLRTPLFELGVKDCILGVATILGAVWIVTRKGVYHLA